MTTRSYHVHKTEICEKIIKEKKREGNVEHLGSLRCGGEAISKCGETSYCSKTTFLWYSIPVNNTRCISLYQRAKTSRKSFLSLKNEGEGDGY